VKTQKAIAIIMILASSVLTARVCGDIAYPAILCMLGLLGLRRRFTWDIRPERRAVTSFLLLVLTIIFALHAAYTSSTTRAAPEQAAAVAWQTVTRYFLASMILVLFLGSPQRLPSSLGLFHVATVISAGQGLLLDSMYVAFRLSELLAVILAVLYVAAAGESTPAPPLSCLARQQRGEDAGVGIPERMGRTFRRLAVGLILAVALNCGWIAGSVLYRHVEVLNYLPVWLGRGRVAESTVDGMSHVGFSTSGKLSSVLLIKGDQDTTPALAIISDDCPGYLRARAFEVYRQSEWYDLSYREAIFPERNRLFGMYFVGRVNIFRLDQTDASECKHMSIRHESQLADAVFTTLGTSILSAPLNLLLLDDNDIIYAPNSRSGLNYRIGYAKSAYQKAPAGVHRLRMLDIPGELDPRIYQLASRIFAGCSTTSEKIDAVINYFHTNYTYALGLDIPPARDKLTHFLLEESTGYCEYFASGAAILLRLAGVPTRYITGFLVTEKDALSESWVARNMDAHAWAEAWDSERNRWVIVEATIQEDWAGASAAEQLGRLGGGIGNTLGQLLEALYRYGLFGLLGWLFKYHNLLASLLALTALFGGTLWLALSRRYYRRRSQREIESRATGNPERLTLHKMLARMDRKVKTAGLWRHLSETLHAFSGRLRARDSGDGLWTRISDWYLEYANLRYRRTISSQRLQKLHNSLEACKKL
jgi:hypothetical protein